MCRKCEATKPLNEFSHEGSVLHSFCNACRLDLVEESRRRRIRGMPDSEGSGLHDHVLTIDDDNDLESPLNPFRERQPALIQSIPLRPPISPVGLHQRLTMISWHLVLNFSRTIGPSSQALYNTFIGPIRSMSRRPVSPVGLTQRFELHSNSL
jgi:hypothetical protein